MHIRSRYLSLSQPFCLILQYPPLLGSNIPFQLIFLTALGYVKLFPTSRYFPLLRYFLLHVSPKIDDFVAKARPNSQFGPSQFRRPIFEVRSLSPFNFEILPTVGCLSSLIILTIRLCYQLNSPRTLV